MTIVKNLLLGLLALIALLVVVGMFLSDNVHVERDTVIAAPPAEVFPLLTNMRAFNRWSPWADLDPDALYTFEGPDDGEGARMTWASENPSVGNGSMDIIESVPHKLVRYQLDFGSQGDAVAYMTLMPEGNGTRVAWAFDTEFGYNIVGRYLGLFLDNWVGSDYEKGLVRLKNLVESGSQSTPD